MTRDDAHPLTRYLPLLQAGDETGMIDLFGGDMPNINDVRFGPVGTLSGLQQFLALSREWLAAHQAAIEPVALTQGDGRAVYEVVLNLAVEGGAIALPVALVGDERGGGALSALRVYHSLWPLLGGHQVRPPVLPKQGGLRLPSVVAAYQAALAAGDLEGVLAQFEPDGMAREPAGGEYVYRGQAALREFYGLLFSNSGGITLEHCTATDDGTRCAIEYNAVAWGATPLPPQAGVAVYERGPSGLLAAARIYDDVDPPVHASA